MTPRRADGSALSTRNGRRADQAVRVVYEFGLADLQYDHPGALEPGAHVRFNLGHLRTHVSSHVETAAVWLAVDAASVEFVGSGTGLRWFAESVTRQCAEQRRAAS